jgi:hypothetical protein
LSDDTVDLDDDKEFTTWLNEQPPATGDDVGEPGFLRVDRRVAASVALLASTGYGPTHACVSR